MLSYPKTVYGWERSIYGKVMEQLLEDVPPGKGQQVVMISFVDAKLLHNVVTGRSVTAVLHFLNKTPIDYYSKRQSTIETATYGSEFVAARTATEQIIDLRITLRYLGANICNEVFLFGDNESVVKSATIPHAKLHKRHVLLSFHRVREAIASGMLRFMHVPGNLNPADILSKAWAYNQVWPILKSILFWEGDTAELLKANDSKLREL